MERAPSIFPELVIRAMDVNELCRGFKRDISRLGLCMARAMLDIESHREAGRITASERDRLLKILKEDIDEEPTADNDLPIFKIRFPAPHHDTPRRPA